MRIWIVIITLGLCAITARAEDIATYEMEGDANAGGSDPRVAALDDAFARAAQAAMQELVDPAVRKANKGPLDKEIIARARLWVAKFTVEKDETTDGRRQLTVLVRVDRDKMRARLAELNIATGAAGEQAGAGQTVVVLLRIESPDGVRATYGAAAEKELPGLGALSATLRGAGMRTRRAPASGPAARSGGDLPLGDDEAAALAETTKADVVTIAGVSVGAPLPVRGIAMPGVLVTARVRVLERGGKLVGQGTAVVAARGSEPSVIGAAIERALVAAAGDVVPPPKSTLAVAPTINPGDDNPIAEAGVVLVRLSPKTPWGLVAAEQRYLSGAKGVQRAVLRRLSPGGWVIGVATTESIERIAQIARKAPASDTRVKVKIVGEIIEVAMTGSP